MTVAANNVTVPATGMVEVSVLDKAPVGYTIIGAYAHWSGTNYGSVNINPFGIGKFRLASISGNSFAYTLFVTIVCVVNELVL